VLAVIDDEARGHRDAQDAHPVHFIFAGRHLLEGNFRIDRDSDGGEDVVVQILGDVAAEVGDARLVELALCAQFGDQFVFVEEKEPRENPERAHGDVVFALRLDASYGGEYVFEACTH